MLCHHVSPAFSGLFSLFNHSAACSFFFSPPFLFDFLFFCKSHRSGERLSWIAGEKISRQLSLLPSGLISPLPPPQSSSPHKKEPLLRCFAGHYKMVAMDTQSEQAPHAGCRKNDKCNIPRNLAVVRKPGMQCCAKRCKSRPCAARLCRIARRVHWRDCSPLAPQRVTWYFPPHLLFVVVP